MDDRDFSELSKEISDKIQKFVKSDEVRQLQENIRATVTQTVGEVKKTFKETADTLNESRYDAKMQKEVSDDRGQKNWGTSEGYRNKTAPAVKKFRQLPVVRRPQGGVAGVLMVIFGSIGSILFWGCSLFGYSVGLLTGKMLLLTILSLGIATPLALLFTGMLIGGGVLCGRAKRFKSYVRTMGEKDFYSIKGLAAAVSKKEKYVVKDLGRMIRRKWFREGHLDEQATCFMLTDESFELYQNAQRELEVRKDEAERLEREQQLLDQDPDRKQMNLAIEEGREYIRRIRKVNDEIPGEEISNKLYRLEKINTRIFEYMEKNPDRILDMRKFMNYYLPTTLKLVESYAEFSAQPVQGEYIRTARSEIEEMLDDINIAFEKMFDKLFEDEAMDISTDISVLSAMLTQEGLLEDELRKKVNVDHTIASETDADGSR